MIDFLWSWKMRGFIVFITVDDTDFYWSDNFWLGKWCLIMNVSRINVSDQEQEKWLKQSIQWQWLQQMKEKIINVHKEENASSK